jgi:hypothetical protein
MRCQRRCERPRQKGRAANPCGRSGRRTGRGPPRKSRRGRDPILAARLGRGASHALRAPNPQGFVRDPAGAALDPAECRAPREPRARGVDEAQPAHVTRERPRARTGDPEGSVRVPMYCVRVGLWAGIASDRGAPAPAKPHHSSPLHKYSYGYDFSRRVAARRPSRRRHAPPALDPATPTALRLARTRGYPSAGRRRAQMNPNTGASHRASDALSGVDFRRARSVRGKARASRPEPALSTDRRLETARESLMRLEILRTRQQDLNVGRGPKPKPRLGFKALPRVRRARNVRADAAAKRLETLAPSRTPPCRRR